MTESPNLQQGLNPGSSGIGTSMHRIEEPDWHIQS